MNFPLQKGPGESDSRDRTILIVDDDPNNLAILSDLLEAAFYKTLIAEDGDIALKRADYARPDLILLDILMPGMDGIETCCRLKKMESTKAIPIIFMTALAEMEHKVKGFEAGAVDYISKPFQREEILARVGIHLRLRELTERLEQKVRERTAELTTANLRLRQEICGRKRAQADKEKFESQFLQAQKMESVGRLAGGVAHDFNNILGVILGTVDLILDPSDPTQPLRNELMGIRKAAERAASLTRQLLAFARKQTIAPKVLDLNETVESMLKILRRLIGENIELAWLPGPGLWPVKLDPTQIDQILANLGINARDAIADVGKVTIETRNIVFDMAYCADHPEFVPGEYVMLAVSDNGCGMDPETRKQIFEPFFTTKGIGQGTGLGLSTVYGIVKQNNGFINVYSEPGGGAAFKIYLPRHAGQDVLPELERVVEIPRGRGETVLLVEDDSAILGLAGKMLERLGYLTLIAGTPEEALLLEAAHPGEIHLLMTDVVMPGLNGRDLADRLRLKRPAVKCLFMSGYTANVIAHHGVLDLGVQFIQKPFSKKELAIKVRETLDRN